MIMLLLTMMLSWLDMMPNNQGQAQTVDLFAVSASRYRGNTDVRLTYPAQQNLWVCVTMRKPEARGEEAKWRPRWCFEPAKTATEVLVIPRWPPVPTTDRWEVSAFVQWYQGRNDSFGYLETGWVEVR